ncbi:MAG: hypothetical protein HQ528_09445 [Candidatus Marinimicrobia bacterium]|nr:hypothetical protein [Candidatus Neomarinimicrobiota bacterium]
MTAFIKIIRGEYGDPETAEEYYNFMNGRVGITGLPYTDPNTGQPGVFVANGDPVTGTGWLDSDRHPSGDRRYMLSSGPFTMAPGEEQEIITAITVARGTDALNSVTAYKYSNRIIQSFFDAGFNAPTMFKCPQVAVANLDKKIVLSWEANADLIESYTILDYRFQGYNIYQGESPDGPWHRLATLDKIDGIHTIIDQVLDPELGLIVTESVQFGTDAGIEHYFEITRDSLTNQNLLNYREYYFGVSAYLVNLEGAPKTLESPIQSVRAVPSETGIGTDLVTNHLDVLKVDHVEGRSDAIFQPRVIDPYQLNNHTYEISFAAVDSITTLWYLVDTDESDTVLTGVNSFPATPEYIVALSDNPYSDHAHIYPAYDMSDGLLLTSENTYLLPPREPNETVITNVDTLTPIIVFGGINPMIGNGYWTSFIGKYLTYIDGIPSMADLSRDIELRCTTDGSIATYYDPGVQAPDTIWVPFELWSAEDSTQINLAIYQTSGYRPIFETDDSTGAIKITKGIYFMPVYKPYDPDWQADPDTDSDIIGWMFWFNIERTLFDNGDIVRINFHNPIQPGVDRYRFQATGTETLTNRQTQNQLDLVNVFPNPYFGYHSEEQHSFDRRVYFTHLGVSKTTIRIFNLSGDPVRTIRTSILSEATSNRRVLWDLTNDAGKYVASGLYIVHITVEDLQGVHIGEKILKLAIFQPK